MKYAEMSTSNPSPVDKEIIERFKAWGITNVLKLSDLHSPHLGFTLSDVGSPARLALIAAGKVSQEDCDRFTQLCNVALQGVKDMLRTETKTKGKEIINAIKEDVF